ncbi:hypothetical protein MCOR25_003721 [Pyricularia grisea]|nr:hypothetical protein MCOR25_003721 [Pyricularia grisea]
MNASIRTATVGQGSRTRRLKQSNIKTTTQNVIADKTSSIEGIHNEVSWHTLLTPPTTPPAAKSPSPSPTSPPIEEEPESYDRYLDGASIQPAELISARPPLSTGPNDSIQSFTFTFRVPRDYTDVTPPSSCNSYMLHAELLRRSSPTPELTAAPIFVYLCGGPGSGQQPDRHRLLNRYVVANGYQMLLLDYRGCGRSQPLTVDSVLERTSRSRRRDGSPSRSSSSSSSSSTHEAVRAFQEVRQGNIVRDFEAVRRFLIDYIPGQRALEERFVLLGQSYGGWIALTYVDRYPGSVKAVLLTGGMPPLGASPERVYARLFDEVGRANELFYARYPEAAEVVRRIAAGILRAQDKRGIKRRRFSKRRRVEERRYGADDNVPSLATFASMGRLLGEPDGARKLHERLALIDKHMAATGGPPRFEDMDTHRFNDRLPYAFDHEIQCYVSTEGQTSNWAARAVRDGNAAYDWISSSTEDELDAVAAASTDRMHFLGEAFMPEHADDYASLRALGGRAFAEEVVRAGQTETLFDMDRLRDNEVPVYAVIYRKDMYVDADLAVEAAAKVGSVKCVRLPETSELRHNAIRESADQVIGIFRDLGFDGFPRDPEI